MSDSYFENDVPTDLLPMSGYKNKEDRAIDFLVLRCAELVDLYKISPSGPNFKFVMSQVEIALEEVLQERKRSAEGTV